MGEQIMGGLLGQNRSAGLLSGFPMNVGATQEALRRKQEADRQAALLAAPPPPQRGPVNPMRVAMRTLFGGEDPFQASDAERARLEAEAARPQMQARMAQLRGMAETMGPAAMIAFETNPEAFGAQLAEQYAPRTTAAGGRTDILGTGQGVAAPSFSTVNDTIFRNNPVGGTSEAVATAPAAFSDVTARFNAENPVLPANSTWVGPDGQPRAQGYVAPEVSSIPQGGSVVVTRDGRPETVVQGNPETGGRNGPANFDATTRGALQSARSAAQQAAQRAADARRFIQLNQEHPTGVGAALLGPLAGLSPGMAEMRAISARLVPGERTPGSGPMSDKDVALYTRAVLDVDKPGPTNQALANVVIAQAERDAEYAAFLDEFATRNGNLNGAQEDWTAYVNANPLFDADADGMTTVRPRVTDWRTFMGYGERQRGGGGQARGGVVTVNTPAEAQALPPGTRYRTPQGQEYIR
jgi:hypothetical protein